MTTYRMCGNVYTWDELREGSNAEAADLPPGKLAPAMAAGIERRSWKHPVQCDQFTEPNP
jgi:hypothetical protein